MVRLPGPSSLGAVLAIVPLLSLCVQSQAIDPDTMDFRQVEGWKDVRFCVTTLFPFPGRCSNCQTIDDLYGCTTNKCICKPSIMGGAIPFLSEQALARCSNYDDQSTAVSIYTAYCSAKGYTEVVAPVIATTGASETVTATATVTVITVVASGSAASARSDPSTFHRSTYALILTGMMAGLGMLGL